MTQAQQQLQQSQHQKHGSSSSSTASPSSSSLVAPGARPPSSSTGGLPGLSALYTGSLPPLIRSGIASLDPRLESARQTHLLSNALKALNIDHEATARETKSAATQTFKWGQDLALHPSSATSKDGPRLDGSCDPALVDITDRFAYILSTIGDLEASHVKRAEAARKEFKDIARAESELSSRREKRVKLHKELLSLVPERAKPSSSKKIAELESQLKTLEAEDKAAEEAFGKLRRQKFQSSYSKHMDSLIELGEKLACAARHGKLLASMVPSDETPVFPAAALAGSKGWTGSEQTAQVRFALDPALRALQIDYSPAQLGADKTIAGGSVQSSAATMSDAASSYAESHAAEIAEADRTQEAVISELSKPSAAGPTGATLGAAPPLPRLDSASSLGTSPAPDPVAPNPMTARLNMEPTPRLPTSPGLDPADSNAGTAASTSPAPPAAAADATHEPSPFAPPEEVTVAETGAAIFGTGGPKTGVLGVPRRKSTAPTGAGISPGVSSSSAAPPPLPPSSTSTSSAAAAKSAEAASERLRAEQAEVEATAERQRLYNRTPGVAPPLSGAASTSTGAPTMVNARLRRDGTIVRRGERDWVAAESEDLPPYTLEDDGTTQTRRPQIGRAHV